MKTIENLQSRIDALDFYHPDHGRNLYPSVNVKIRGRVKGVEEIANNLKLEEPIKSQAIQIIQSRDDSEQGGYFWDVCEQEGRYAMEIIFDGVAHNSDEPEQKHIAILKEYKGQSGFFGRSGGHFCLGVAKDDLEQFLTDAEEYPDGANESLGQLSDLLDAIEWALATVKAIAEGVPESIEDAIKYDLEEESDRLKREEKERQTPRYKIDRLREWEKSLSDTEREKLRRSIVSIEKILGK